MSPYLFYVWRNGRTIPDLHIVLQDGDRQAHAHAGRLLAEGADRVSVEIWDGDRAAGVIARPQLRLVQGL